LLWTIFVILLVLRFKPAHVAHDQEKSLRINVLTRFKDKSMKFKENM